MISFAIFFDHPLKGKGESKKILTLKQGQRFTDEYTLEFQTLAAG